MWWGRQKRFRKGLLNSWRRRKGGGGAREQITKLSLSFSSPCCCSGTSGTHESFAYTALRLKAQQKRPKLQQTEPQSLALAESRSRRKHNSRNDSETMGGGTPGPLALAAAAFFKPARSISRVEMCVCIVLETEKQTRRAVNHILKCSVSC